MGFEISTQITKAKGIVTEGKKTSSHKMPPASPQNELRCQSVRPESQHFLLVNFKKKNQ
jgi:hypothetical protein